MNGKNLLSLLLALVMVLACLVFVSCGDDAKNPAKDSGNTPGSTDTDPNRGEDYLLRIPKQQYGKTYTFLTDEQEHRVHELYFESEDDAIGDTMDTAIYYRNNRVAEYLGVTFENITADGSWNNKAGFIDRMFQSYTTGDQDYQMAGVYGAYAAEGAVKGYYYDIKSINAINSESPWYVQSWLENTTINNRTYMVLSDLSYSMWRNLHALYFNKQLGEQYGLNDQLYILAEDGELTLEAITTYAELCAQDDGNDVWDTNDIYGMYLNKFICRAMLTYFDIPLTRLNEAGEYELCFYTERTEDIYGVVHNYIWQNDYIYTNVEKGKDGDFATGVGMFVENRLLFLPATLNQSQNLREMEGEFGILPMPKYDETQAEYRSHSTDTYTLFIIPAQTNDPEFCGTVLDALSAESKYSVIPMYYDVVIKGRTTKDEQSIAMLDIIRDNLTFDFAFAHLSALDGIWTSWGDSVTVAGNTSYKTTYDKKAEGYQERLEEIMASYWAVH